MLRCHRVIVFLSFVATCAVGAGAQVLSYSTYLPSNVPFPIAGVPIAVNDAGEVCAVFINYRAGAKLRSDGSVAYAFSNIPGPSSGSFGNATLVAIDSNGNCYVAGFGPITPTPGAFQSISKSPPSSPSPFIVKFDGAGNISFATYLGGSGVDTPTGMAVDNSGNVYLTGVTSSNDFPTLNAHQPVLATAPDLFIAVLNPTGTGLLYSTYWGGSGTESNPAIAVDPLHNAYVTGGTDSKDFPTVHPLQATLTGSPSAFVIKLGPTGAPVYSTYLGGLGGGAAIAADSGGSAYVAGYTGNFNNCSRIGPCTSPSAFVSKLSSTGSALSYSASLWGTPSVPNGIVVDPTGQAYTTGISSSVPLVSPIQTILGTGFNNHGFVSVLNTAGTAFTFSTSLGEDASPTSIGIDSSPNINIYISGMPTRSSLPFPILNAPTGTYVPGVLSPGFVSKISLSPGISLSHPDTVDFRGGFHLQAGRDSGSADVLVANTSAVGTVSISNIGITMGDFTETNDCPVTPVTLPAASSCLVHVTFTPTAGGDRTGTITITDSLPGSPHIVNLIGTGLTPMASLSPTSLTFAPQAVGTQSGVQQVTLTNSGGAVLMISNVGITGDFSETNTCGTGLLPSAGSNTCQISIAFSPTALGNQTGVLSISDNASGSPHTVNLSGQGVNPSLGLGVPPGGSSSAVVAAGASASYTLSNGGGGMGGTASLSCTDAPKGAACALPNTLNVGGTTSATFNVTVSTTSRTMAAVRAAQWERLWAMTILGLVVLAWSRPAKDTAKCYLLLSVVVALFLSSCGGGQSSPQPNRNGTPAGTYNLTVTATVGSAAQSTSLTLIVQ